LRINFSRPPIGIGAVRPALNEERMMEWETVIGLEVHMQLATQSKIFSGSSTAFGAEPNTQASAIDLAMPGTLPVLNEQAVRLAIRFAHAIKAELNRYSAFERKNYFYPDLPKGYQTTQLVEPIIGRGVIEIDVPGEPEPKPIYIHHAHLEEDAGKSLHEDFHGQSGIDLNRAGTPLIEIVTEPNMSSAKEAVTFAKKLHEIVTKWKITDGDMSQGSMRFDVNISIKRKNDPNLGTRTETKNLNSFRFIEEAIELEVERQKEILEGGGKIIQETRLYDGESKTARAMRSKEEANDYRYFPCPDLLPIEVPQKMIDEEYARPDPFVKHYSLTAEPGVFKIEGQNNEFTIKIKNLFYLLNSRAYGLRPSDAEQIARDSDLLDYFEAVAQISNQPQLTVSWILGELSAKLNAANITIAECPLMPEELANIIKRLADGELHGKQAKQLFEKLWEGKTHSIKIQPDNFHMNSTAQHARIELVGQQISMLINELGLKQVSDTGAIETIVADIVAANPAQVEKYRAADENKRKKLLGFFVGQIMKASKGQANPSVVNDILLKTLEA
jgi:aspartyl-tRNA(Asn)/glutamyl-tRNA(Gln) amidotransferase subunit B